MSTHRKSCEKIQKFKCSICDFKTNRNYRLLDHLRKKHNGSPEKEHNCHRCDFVSPTKAALKSHISNSHAKLACHKCGRQFLKEDTLRKHVEAHERLTLSTSSGHFFKFVPNKKPPPSSPQEKSPGALTSKKKHPCLSCPHVARSPYDLKIHRFKVHEKERQVKPRIIPKCIKCGYISKWGKRNFDRHVAKCQHVCTGQITMERILELICDTNCSFRDLPKISKLVRYTFGKGAVEPNLLKNLRKQILELGVWFNTRFITLKDKEKNDMKTCVSFVKDHAAFRDWIIQGRGIQDPKVTWSFDSGQGKFVVCMNIFDMAAPAEPNKNGHKPSGCRLTLPVLQCDLGRRLPESHYNVKKLMQLITPFPEDPEFSLTGDKKGVNISTGIVSVNGTFHCSYCKGFKVSALTGKPTNKRGLHVKKDPRCYQFQIDQNKLLEAPLEEGGGGGDRGKQADFFNVVEEPLNLQEGGLDRPIVFVHPPEPLHDCLLGKLTVLFDKFYVRFSGPPNDVLECLEERFPDEMEAFYRKHNCNPGKTQDTKYLMFPRLKLDDN